MDKATCDLCAPWVQPYLDNELSTEKALPIAAHLRECPACSRLAQTNDMLKKSLRDPSLYYALPDSVNDAVSASLPQTRHGGWRSRAPSCVSAMALAASLLLYVSTPSAEQELADAALSNHVRSLMAEHLNDVASSDRHTVKPWFTGKLDFAPPVVDLADKGFALAGGRLDYLGDRPVAALVYQHNKHIINVFVGPSTEPDSAPVILNRRGYNLVLWHKDQMRLIAVSDLNKDDLGNFVALLRQP